MKGQGGSRMVCQASCRICQQVEETIASDVANSVVVNAVKDLIYVHKLSEVPISAIRYGII